MLEKVGCQLHSTFLSTLKHEILRNNFRQMLCIRQQQAHEIGICVPVAFSPHHPKWVVKIGIHCQGNAATLCKRRLFCLNRWIQSSVVLEHSSGCWQPHSLQAQTARIFHVCNAIIPNLQKLLWWDFHAFQLSINSAVRLAISQFRGQQQQIIVACSDFLQHSHNLVGWQIHICYNGDVFSGFFRCTIQGKSALSRIAVSPFQFQFQIHPLLYHGIRNTRFLLDYLIDFEKGQFPFSALPQLIFCLTPQCCKIWHLQFLFHLTEQVVRLQKRTQQQGIK